MKFETMLKVGKKLNIKNYANYIDVVNKMAVYTNGFLLVRNHAPAGMVDGKYSLTQAVPELKSGVQYPRYAEIINTPGHTKVPDPSNFVAPLKSAHKSLDKLALFYSHKDDCWTIVLRDNLAGKKDSQGNELIGFDLGQMALLCDTAWDEYSLSESGNLVALCYGSAENDSLPRPTGILAPITFRE